MLKVARTFALILVFGMGLLASRLKASRLVKRATRWSVISPLHSLIPRRRSKFPSCLKATLMQLVGPPVARPWGKSRHGPMRFAVPRAARVRRLGTSWTSQFAEAPRQKRSAPMATVLGPARRLIGVLKDGRSPLRDRNEALKWIVHLIGDIHQPLHDSTMVIAAAAPSGHDAGIRSAHHGTRRW